MKSFKENSVLMALIVQGLRKVYLKYQGIKEISSKKTKIGKENLVQSADVI